MLAAPYAIYAMLSEPLFIQIKTPPDAAAAAAKKAPGAPSAKVIPAAKVTPDPAAAKPPKSSKGKAKKWKKVPPSPLEFFFLFFGLVSIL